MELPVRYLTIPKDKQRYARTRSLAEQLARRELVRQGYAVTRGGMLDAFLSPTGFDASTPARAAQKALVSAIGKERFLRIAKYCTRNHGTPDLLAVHSARGVVAIEVKLGQEAVAPHQLTTMRRLMEWGVACELWRVAPSSNKVRAKQVDLGSWSETGDLRASTTKTAYERKVTVYGKRRRKE